MMPVMLQAFNGGEGGEVPVEDVIGGFEPIRPLSKEHSGEEDE